MKLIKVKTYDEMSKLAANMIAAQVVLKPKCVLGLATGSTPIGAYEKLIEKYNAGELDFSGVRSINLDEYVGLDGSHDQSYRYFMNTNLFDHVNIDKANTYVPFGKAENLEAECEAYEKRIGDFGGIDLQLLGIGHDGHIGFNEPGSSFAKSTHVEELAESTIKANARFFANESDVPTKAITMGMAGIMQAKRVLLVANGAAKWDILEKALFGPITPEIPASILQLHKDVTVIYSEN